MKLANSIFAQSAARGVLPMLYAASAPRADGGTYYGPGGPLNMRGTPTRQTSSDDSRDEAGAERLWTKSESLTGVSYEFDALSSDGA
ncbi:hypothetical protein [Natrarchaeobius halalkaliphilus]